MRLPKNQLSSFSHPALAWLLLLTSYGQDTTARDAANQVAGSGSAPAVTPGKASPLVATFGGGCFWCTEAVMEALEGVLEVKSGYMGGHVENPTYEQVCQKNTGHVEVVQVSYDPGKISYEELLDVFWQAHDPTTLDRQGEDRGPQYRSVLFTHDAGQRNLAELSKRTLDESGKLAGSVVTEIRDAGQFWEAEADHQDFYRNNPNFGYCRAVISPKMKKLGFE